MNDTYSWHSSPVTWGCPVAKGPERRTQAKIEFNSKRYRDLETAMKGGSLSHTKLVIFINRFLLSNLKPLGLVREEILFIA
jgi:hypothetical protein